MSGYHVYGVGNALVDMEYVVDADAVAALGLRKGVMTLVDARQQGRMVAQLHDHTPKKGCGGSAANSLIAMAQLGARCFYSCRVAGDPLGAFYLEDMARAGVRTNAHDPSLPGDTGTCVVMVTPDADRTMATYLGVTGELSERELNAEAIVSARIVYCEGYLASSDRARDSVVTARRMAEQAGVKTALSLSDPNMVTLFKANLLEMIGGGVDIVFANEQEAKQFTGSDDLAGAVAGLLRVAKQCVITLGPRGALIADGETRFEVPGKAVAAVDTNGAGDMFAGAYLYGLTHGWTMSKAAELAVAASARLITHVGARMPAAALREVLRASL